MTVPVMAITKRKGVLMRAPGLSEGVRQNSRAVATGHATNVVGGRRRGEFTAIIFG